MLLATRSLLSVRNGNLLQNNTVVARYHRKELCAYKRDAPNITIMTFLELEVRFNSNIAVFHSEGSRVSERRLQRLTASTWDES